MKFDLNSLRTGYREGRFTPASVKPMNLEEPLRHAVVVWRSNPAHFSNNANVAA